MAGAATYLYQDGPHYWYSTQPTVTKLAEDRAEQLKREPDKINEELERRLRKDLQQNGDFNRVHPFPQNSADVPDDFDARLVVLGRAYPYSRESNSPAEVVAREILENRGNSPRVNRNTLVFLAPDKTRLEELDESTRRYLAWESIIIEQTNLNLSPYQVSQAQTQKNAADAAVTARIPETYQWVIVPIQNSPQSEVTWEALKLSGQEPLAIRASRKLRADELYLTSFSPTRLRMELDRIPLWRGNHVEVRQLVEDFSRYLYLPRLKAPTVLLNSVRDGVSLMTWEIDGFAFADAFDQNTKRYQALRVGKMISLDNVHSPELVVKSEIASHQLHEIKKENPDNNLPATPVGEPTIVSGPEVSSKPKRFYGVAPLDPTRVGRDASRIAEEVISHLAGLVGADVKVTIEIEASIPDGASDNLVRTVTENSRTLKFTSHGFEQV
jgi:hypothetical protein